MPLPSSAAVAAPAECLSTLRNIISYIFKEKPDITKDEAAQTRWLSKGLKQAIVTRQENCSREQKARPTDEIDFPSNELFVGFWSYPTAYSILGSRRYDSRAIIDVLYSWDKGTDYEGDREVVSFIFTFENKTWLLDDIHFFHGEYREPGSLQEELERHY